MGVEWGDQGGLGKTRRGHGRIGEVGTDWKRGRPGEIREDPREVEEAGGIGEDKKDI